MLRFISLTNRKTKAHFLVRDSIIASIEDLRFDSPDFAWTNILLSNGTKYEVLETEPEIINLLSKVGG